MTDQFKNLGIQCVNPCDGGSHPFTPNKVLQLTHRLSETGLFDDSALIELLDTYPAEDLQVSTMSTGAAGLNEPASHWRAGTTEDLTGEEILTAVRKGRLWVNIKRLAENAPDYRLLMSAIYQQLGQQLQVQAPQWQRATLLLSSPTASVYYHADSIPNLLWHLRGEKKVFVYPHNNPNLASPEAMEMICNGETEEELPYHADFESFAEMFHLKTGQAIAWPQNSPHRVENVSGLNVSLSTEHLTPQARQKVNLYRGNRMLRKFGLQPKFSRPDSLSGRTKQALAICQSATRKIFRKAPISFEFVPTFRVDPDAELGYRDIS